jgi:NAD(P)-dependent dehydrogenase (short-subunit alcohol dehydrogenase family)
VIAEAVEVASSVAAGLMAEGYQVRQASPDSLPLEDGPIGGVVNLLGLEPDFRSAGLLDAEAAMKSAALTFKVVKQYAAALQAHEDGGWFVNVTALDGHFGLGPSPLPLSPEGRGVWGEGVAAAGTLGIVKTLGREYPRLRVKNVDVEPNMPTDILAARLIEEITTDDDLIEVGLARTGRWQPALRKAAAHPSLSLATRMPALDRDSVLLVTGGARGITAAVARRLASETKLRLVLVGRSPLPDAESPQTRGLDRAELRRLLLDEARRHGGSAAPAEIERSVNRILKDREVHANLDACSNAGASVEYHALDVRDGQAFERLIDGLYERFGRIDGVIHGAGIIDDRRIRDKTSDSFAAVFRTKVDSALTLARKIRPEGLKFLAFFGSVSGRFGNAGQVDYSAANEVLNKLADCLNRRWLGRVVCLNWGPWQGGMVSEDLRRLYAAAGVQLISVEEGVSAFLAEMGRTDRQGAEIVLGLGIERFQYPPAAPAGAALVGATGW